MPTISGWRIFCPEYACAARGSMRRGIPKKSAFLFIGSSEADPGWIGEVMKHKNAYVKWQHVSGRMNIVEIMLLLSATV